jgi:hypothetical protein
MASRPYKERLGAYGAASFLQGLLQGTKDRQEMERMAAERMLKQQQDARDADLKDREFRLNVAKAKQGSTTIGTDGKVYYAPGLSDQDVASLTGRRGKQLPEGTFSPTPGAGSIVGRSTNPNVTTVGAGKLNVQKPETQTLILSPDAARGMTGQSTNKKVVIAPAEKTGGSLTPDVRFALDTSRQLMKEYISNGSLTAPQAALLKDASRHLDLSVIPEEEHGLVAFIQKATGNPQFGVKVEGGAGTSAPAGQMKPLTDKSKALQYLNLAGGDKNKARALAAKDGYSF